MCILRFWDLSRERVRVSGIFSRVSLGGEGLCYGCCVAGVRSFFGEQSRECFFWDQNWPGFLVCM